MKKVVSTTISLKLILGLLLATPTFAGGGGSKKKPLADSNPIVLSHGILGFDDSEGLLNGFLKYWGGMDEHLRSEGADVLTTGKTAISGYTTRAVQEKEQILLWMAANGYDDVNIMSHSQGAIDNRYMIANLGMQNKVAVLTTINGVHRGAPLAGIADSIIPSWLQGFVDVVLSFLGDMLYGDANQDLAAAVSDMNPTKMTAFNANTPNVGSVEYFSYGSKMTLPDPIQHPIFFLINPVTAIGGAFYGQGTSNDGVVPHSSQKWGKWKGGPDYNFWVTGVDHAQAINFLSMGEIWYDVEDYYLDMAKNAQNNQ